MAAPRQRCEPATRLSIAHELARRFMLHAQGLLQPAPDLAAAIAHMGYVQMDPINVCGRMHDLILRHRVHNYAEHDLLRHLYPVQGPRQCFEHFLPGKGILVTFPLAAWPFLVPHMRQRARHDAGFNGRLPASEKRLARRILDEIGTRGALAPEQILHEGRSTTAWGSSGRTVKIVLEKLFVHGEVLITQRRDFRRVYDLPHRVLPPDTLAARPASDAQSRRWRVLQRLRQHRLMRLGRDELPLVLDSVARIDAGEGPSLFCLLEDLPLLEHAASWRPGDHPPRLIAPLDPLIYDRALTARLWDYDYTWEVYTPPQRRVRGYYALPLLSDDELVGHVDARADRASGRLQPISRKTRRGHASQPALAELARFLVLRAGAKPRPRRSGLVPTL
jgi:uncharacterized protein